MGKQKLKLIKTKLKLSIDKKSNPTKPSKLTLKTTVKTKQKKTTIKDPELF